MGGEGVQRKQTKSDPSPHAIVRLLVRFLSLARCLTRARCLARARSLARVRSLVRTRSCSVSPSSALSLSSLSLGLGREGHSPNWDRFNVRPEFITDPSKWAGSRPPFSFGEYLEFPEYQNIATRMLAHDSFPCVIAPPPLCPPPLLAPVDRPRCSPVVRRRLCPSRGGGGGGAGGGRRSAPRPRVAAAASRAPHPGTPVGVARAARRGHLLLDAAAAAAATLCVLGSCRRPHMPSSSPTSG